MDGRDGVLVTGLQINIVTCITSYHIPHTFFHFFLRTTHSWSRCRHSCRHVPYSPSPNRREIGTTSYAVRERGKTTVVSRMTASAATPSLIHCEQSPSTSNPPPRRCHSPCFPKCKPRSAWWASMAEPRPTFRHDLHEAPQTVTGACIEKQGIPLPTPKRTSPNLPKFSSSFGKNGNPNSQRGCSIKLQRKIGGYDWKGPSLRVVEFDDGWRWVVAVWKFWKYENSSSEEEASSLGFFFFNFCFLEVNSWSRENLVVVVRCSIGKFQWFPVMVFAYLLLRCFSRPSLSIERLLHRLGHTAIVPYFPLFSFSFLIDFFLLLLKTA